MKSGHCVKACKQKRLSLERLEVRSMLAADLVISEFLASSSGGLADEDGDFPDWIELHNRGASDAHLAGWYLTDNASNLAKWQLPAETLAPGGTLLVFA
ncbi:MAG TPA: lamin tail domain-containing protein, partial [Lacipirellulaceae bacterium]|nr:lamin tail domain-containing protein [Lacipirellulaceae bacterium]